MTRLRNTTTRSERGASMVEFALILPLLLLFLFGVIQFGLLFFRFQGIQAAAREGARVASISTYDSSEIGDRVDDTLDDIPFDGTPTVTISPASASPCQGRSGLPVTVTIVYDNDVDIPLLPTMTKTMHAKAEFRCE
jgi:Flp pilus assembly protein TadG